MHPKAGDEALGHGLDQAVSLDDAIRAVTIDAARQIVQGDRLGSLEKGKEADFTILESDPYKVSKTARPIVRDAKGARNPDAIAEPTSGACAATDK